MGLHVFPIQIPPPTSLSTHLQMAKKTFLILQYITLESIGTGYITIAFKLAFGHPGLERKILGYCTLYCAVLCLATQSCPTLLTPWTVVHQAPLSMGIPQARTLEWVAMPSSKGSSHPRHWTQVSHIAGRFFTIWATRETHEHWRRWLISSPGNLPNPGIKQGSPALEVNFLSAELQGSPTLQSTGQ